MWFFAIGGLCILFLVTGTFAVTIAFRKWDDPHQATVLGHFTSATFTAGAALLAAYIAYSGIQRQLSAQERALDFQRLETLGLRVGQLQEIADFSARFAGRVEAETPLELPTSPIMAPANMPWDEPGWLTRLFPSGPSREVITTILNDLESFAALARRTSLRSNTRQAVDDFVASGRAIKQPATHLFNATELLARLSDPKAETRVPKEARDSLLRRINELRAQTRKALADLARASKAATDAVNAEIAVTTKQYQALEAQLQ